MPIPELSTALAATKAVLQIVKGLNDTSNKVAINDAVIGIQTQVIELTDKLISIQISYDEIIKEKSKIEKDLIEERKKNEERQEYTLEPIDGSFAYKYIGSSRAPHYLCATCYDKGLKSVFHKNTLNGLHRYHCKNSDGHDIYHRK